MRSTHFWRAFALGVLLSSGLAWAASQADQDDELPERSSESSPRSEALEYLPVDLSGVTFEPSIAKPPNPELEAAIRALAPDPDSRQQSRYIYNEVDLNDDGTPEVLVGLVGLFFCGTSGCTVAILSATDSGYVTHSDISSVHLPIIVSEAKTHGWRDLILWVAGGGAEPGFAIARYAAGEGDSADGEAPGGYPGLGWAQPRLLRGTRIRGRAFLPEASGRVGLMGVIERGAEGDAWHLFGTEGSAP